MPAAVRSCSCAIARLFAQRFDEQRLELRGAAVQLADRVGSILDYGFFSASPSVLVYREPDPLYQLTWFDRDGRELGRVGTPEPVAGLALSPAGDRALVAKHVPHNVVDQDLWLFNLARNENPTKLTFAASLESWPAWLTNDRFAYGAGGGERTIYEQTIGNDKNRRESFQGFGSSGVTAADSGRVAVFLGWENPKMGIDLSVRTGNGPPGGVPLITGEGHQGSRNCRLMVSGWRTCRPKPVETKCSSPRFALTARPGRSASARAYPSPTAAGSRLDGAAMGKNCCI